MPSLEVPKIVPLLVNVMIVPPLSLVMPYTLEILPVPLLSNVVIVPML